MLQYLQYLTDTFYTFGLTYLTSLPIMIYFIILALSFLILPKKTIFYRYSRNVLVVLDIMVNAVFLAGDYRETISSRIGKAYKRGVVWIIPIMYLINLIFYPIERDLHHCVKSIQPDVGELTLWRWK